MRRNVLIGVLIVIFLIVLVSLAGIIYQQKKSEKYLLKNEPGRESLESNIGNNFVDNSKQNNSGETKVQNLNNYQGVIKEKRGGSILVEFGQGDDKWEAEVVAGSETIVFLEDDKGGREVALSELIQGGEVLVATNQDVVDGEVFTATIINQIIF
jgi:hypothetical protein